MLHYSYSSSTKLKHSNEFKKPGLKCPDWSYYDMTGVVFNPKTMTADKLNDQMRVINKKIYSWPAIFKKALCTLSDTRDFMAMMFAFNSNINYRNVGRNLHNANNRKKLHKAKTRE